MMKFLCFYESNDIYFYYGLYTKRDFDLISRVIQLFSCDIKNLYPTFNNLQCFSSITNKVFSGSNKRKHRDSENL